MQHIAVTVGSIRPRHECKFEHSAANHCQAPYPNVKSQAEDMPIIYHTY